MSQARPKTYGDSQIQQEVLRELKWDSRIEPADVGVTVKAGVVTLVGVVRTFAEKLAAQEAVHRVKGVLDVANDLEVKFFNGATRSDTEIAGAVRHALEWDVWVPDERIQSTVSDGWVTLEGMVDLLRQREDAERAVRRLAGVRSIKNKIVVAGPKISSEEVKDMIEDALERRAEREASRIKVSVSGGLVTLSGLVRSRAEKRAIVGTVSHAPGVRAVNDEILIDPLS
jgi:osmotically-inducible protein OsmY